MQKAHKKTALKSLSIAIVLWLIPLFFAYFNLNTKSYAATSSHLNFQARLSNLNGSVVPDGNYNVEFKLYDALSGGTNLWTETRLNNNVQGVRIVAGYLSVNLGSVNAFPAINWDQDLYLTMNVGNTNPTCTPLASCSPDGELSPRLKLTAVPYAFQAQNAEQLTYKSGANTGTLSFNTVANDPDILLPDISGTNNVLLQSGTTLFTQGSVPFTDSTTGLLTQDNTNFYFDDANNTLGIGTTRTGAINGTGNARLIVKGSGATSSTSSLNVTNSSDASLFFVRDDGNVGIGTANPLVSLHIAGSDPNIIIERASENGSSQDFVFRRARGSIGSLSSLQDGDQLGDIFFAGHDGTDYEANAYIRALIDGTVSNNVVPTALTFATGPTNTASERLRIAPDGNVGINDTSPDARLEVLSTTEQLRLSHTDNTKDVRLTVDTNGHLTLDASSDGTGAQTLALTGFTTLSANGALTVSSGGAGALSLDSASGRVSIANGDFLQTSVAGASGAAAGDIWYDSTAQKYKINENGTTKILCNQTDLSCGAGATTTLQNAYDEDAGSDDAIITLDATGSLIFRNPSSSGSGSNNVLTVEQLDTGASKSGLLVVNAGGSSGYSFRVDDQTSDTTPFVIDSSGNVGIGTSSPSAKLHIQQSATSLPSLHADTGFVLQNNAAGENAILQINGNAAQSSQIRFGDQNSENQGTISYEHTVDSLHLFANATEGLRISSTGNVSIGDVMPEDGQLSIRQDSTADIFNLYDGATNVFTVLDGGNVGIGTSNPSSFKLQVAGHLGPDADDTYDLGSNSLRWRDLYLGGETIHIGTSLTDEATIGYNTSTNILNFGTDATTNGDIAFLTNQLFLDKSNSFVGVGTATPGAKLDVQHTFTSTTAGADNGLSVTVSDTGVVTTGIDTTYGQKITVNRSGATGGALTTAGLQAAAYSVSTHADTLFGADLLADHSGLITSGTKNVYGVRARAETDNVTGGSSITATHLTTARDTADQTSYTTASISPTANNLVLITVFHRVSSGTANVPTITGNSLTWEEVETEQNGSATKIHLFRAMGSSPTTGAVTIDFGGQTQQHADWSISEFSGVNQAGTNGSGAIVQSNGTTGGPNNHTITLGEFSSVDNFAYGGFSSYPTAGATLGSGFTLLGQSGGGTDSSRIISEYKQNDNTVDISFDASTTIMGVAAEIRSGAGDTGGNINTYGGYFSAFGNPGGSSTAYGLYASALGADNNYAAIFENGNVGIGTITPTEALHVVGDARITGLVSCATVQTDATGLLSCGEAAKYFDAYDNTGGDAIGGGVTVNLDTVRKNSDGSVFSLSGDELTINETGTYTIMFRVSATLSAGTRGAIRAYLEEDSGGGYSEVDGSRAYAYGRITTYPEATATGFLTIDVTAGDKFRLRAVQESGTFNTVADGSSLVVTGAVAGAVAGGGGASTLQQAYDGGSAGDQTILLNSTQDSITVQNPASSGSSSEYVLSVNQLATGSNGGLYISSLGADANFALRVDDSTSDTTPFVVTNTGNVGIGITNPNLPLHIRRDLGVGSGEHALLDLDRTTQTDLRLGYRANGSTVTGGFVRSGNNTSLFLGTSGANEAITILNGGNVGIGGTNIGYKLSVMDNNVGGTATSLIYNIATSGASNARLLAAVTSASTGDPYLHLSKDSGTDWYVAQDTSDSAKFKISTGVTVGSSTLMTIQTDGNVGIGTTAPGEKLHVQGTGQAFIKAETTNSSALAGLIIQQPNRQWEISTNDGVIGEFRIKDNTAGAERLKIDSSGNVGIGSSFPGDRLEVFHGNSFGDGGILATNSITDATVKAGRFGTRHYTNAEEPFYGVFMEASNGANAINLGGGTSIGNAATEIRLYTASNSTTTTGSERLRIDSDGDLGINVTDPTRRLDVNGTWGGNVVNSTITNSGTGTTTVSTPGLAYFLSITNTDATSDTRTFNITGVPNTEGTFIFVTSQAIDSGGAGTATIIVQINGTQVSTATQGINGNTTRENYTIAYINGAWRIVGLNSGTAQPANGADTADLAEWIRYTGEEPQAGEVLTIGDEPVSVKKSSIPYDSKLIGVVTTNPHTVMGQNDGQSVRLALSGRVPVKVSTENGIIGPGDPLTASSIPGVAMKATQAGKVIGVALEGYSGQGIGQVMLFINSYYYTPPISATIQGAVDDYMSQANLNFADINVSGSVSTLNLTVTNQAMIKDLKVTGSAEFAGDIKLAGVGNSRNAITKKFIASKPIAVGEVVIADPLNDGQVTTTAVKGDRKVLGIAVTAAVGAGDEIEIAIGGMVQAKFDTAASAAGDLIISSDTEGKATNGGEDPRTGTVLGKATSTPNAAGLIWILVTLQ